MRLGRIIGVSVVLIALLFLTASYVGYSDYVTNLKTHGDWMGEVQGKVYLTGGSLYVTFTTFRAHFESSPSIPSFDQYLGDKFSSPSSKQQSIPENQTFAELRVVVTVVGANGFHKTLLDKTTRIPYFWAGGDIGANNEIGSFSYSFGPYIAYHQYSPLKLTGQATVGQAKATQAFYLTIPDMTQTGGI
jgi:hypothetical protein